MADAHENQEDFGRLIERLRTGDKEAAEQLVRQFEPEIRRFVHFRLTSPSVRRFVDSFDICQSVMARFFVFISRTENQITEPGQLKALLLAIARNRVYDAVNAQHANRRDARRLVNGPDEQLAAVADPAATPSRVVSDNELLEAIRTALRPEDRDLVEQRMLGREWSDLAKEMQSTSEAVRKRANRAIEQAANQLGLRET